MNKQLILNILKGNKIQASFLGEGFSVTIEKVSYKVTLEQAREAQILHSKALSILKGDYVSIVSNQFSFLSSESEISALAFVGCEEKIEKEFDASRDL